jgi:NAD(P)-dependent dehydrogenase (short-subunit alcohol dehydrogenase family)
MVAHNKQNRKERGREKQREAVSKEKKDAPQQSRRPGLEHEMSPKPLVADQNKRGSGKLDGKVALISGADSGIGRATAVLFAREGADIAFVYLNEHKDADETVRLVTGEGRRCIKFAGDVGDEKFCGQVVEKAVQQLGKLDILVNNAAEQHPQNSLEDITQEQLEHTFRTNIFGYFFLTKHALKHLREGSTIVNTTSVTAYKGSPKLLDYSATKGAIVAFTRSLSQALAEKKIRVNGVAPGPIWTPLIPSTFPKEKIEKFGEDVPLKRAGQPEEVAPCFLFLASNDSSYMTGQILHPNGGAVVNG